MNYTIPRSSLSFPWHFFRRHHATRTAPCAATQRSRARSPCGATSCPWAASGTRPSRDSGGFSGGNFFPEKKSTKMVNEAAKMVNEAAKMVN